MGSSTHRIQTRGRWVRRSNATSELCRPHDRQRLRVTRPFSPWAESRRCREGRRSFFRPKRSRPPWWTSGGRGRLWSRWSSWTCQTRSLPDWSPWKEGIRTLVHFLGKLRLIGQMHVLVLKRMGSNPNLLKRPIIMPPPEPIQILLSSMSRFMHLSTWPITNAFFVYLKICYILQIRHRIFYRENLALKH